MIIINNIEAGILGLLCEKSMYGYEIEKIIEERNMRMWTEISFSTIYYVLKKLEKKVYVKSESKIIKNRMQKIYSVTKEGKKVFQEKVKLLISKWERPIWPIEIGLSNISILNKKTIQQCFENYIESIDKAITIHKELEKYLLKNCDLANVSLARRPLYILEAEKRWIKELLPELVKTGENLENR